jgi:hypothetical protein
MHCLILLHQSQQYLLKQWLSLLWQWGQAEMETHASILTRFENFLQWQECHGPLP